MNDSRHVTGGILVFLCSPLVFSKCYSQLYAMHGSTPMLVASSGLLGE